MSMLLSHLLYFYIIVYINIYSYLSGRSDSSFDSLEVTLGLNGMFRKKNVKLLFSHESLGTGHNFTCGSVKLIILLSGRDNINYKYFDRDSVFFHIKMICAHH